MFIRGFPFSAGCIESGSPYLIYRKGATMKTRKQEPAEQPEPFTPGIAKGMVRQHAFMLYRDKLKAGERLTLENWVLAEKDLVKTLDAEGVTATQPEGR